MAPEAGHDVRILRLLANNAALALGHAAAWAELTAARRRIAVLEGVRSSLAKFVPDTVRELVDQAEGFPALAKREVDVSVLFIDIVGYTRLSEQLASEWASDLLERYFGAFLDEIRAHDGDVNELAGDGLMAIVQHPDPCQHVRSAVRAALGILQRTREHRDRFEPIALHVGINSGLATLGVTRIESALDVHGLWAHDEPRRPSGRAGLGRRGDDPPGDPGTVVGEFPLEDLGELRSGAWSARSPSPGSCPSKEQVVLSPGPRFGSFSVPGSAGSEDDLGRFLPAPPLPKLAKDGG
jgi:hypothetical protein